MKSHISIIMGILIWYRGSYENKKNINKNPQTKEDTFWIFTDFHGVMRVHNPTRTIARNYINGAANPEIAFMLLLFQILCINWFFFRKSAYFKRKFIKYLMELTWVGSNHLKVFWKMDDLSC